jgi:hypothetical protein
VEVEQRRLLMTRIGSYRHDKIEAEDGTSSSAYGISILTSVARTGMTTE